MTYSTNQEQQTDSSQGSDGEQTSSGIEFTTIHLSIPVAVKEDAQELANSHYGGHVSQLVRAAIYDHERSLKDEDLMEMKRMRNELAELVESFEGLEEHIEQVGSQNESIEAQLDSTRKLFGENDSVSGVARELRQYLSKRDRPVTRLTIVEDMDFPPAVLRDALGLLVDHGVVQRIERDGEPEFAYVGLGGESDD